MTLLAEFSAEAEEELEAAAVWFDEQRPRLGSEFLEAVDDALALIVDWPRSGPIVGVVSDGVEVRRAPIPRFRFHLGYLVLDDRVRVLAVAHDHRKPGYWRTRARG